jgi:GT2 family glycosyltransferase
VSPETRHVAALQRLLGAMRERVDFVEGSRFWKIRAAFFAFKARLGAVHDPAPPPVPPREYVEAMAASDPYARWLLEHDTRPAELSRLREIAQALPKRPSIAIVVDDACGGADDALARARAQIYPWARTVATSSLWAESHPAESRGTVTSRFAAALESCDDEWLAFCREGELLAPDAAFEVALGALHPRVDLIYGDRDAIDEHGARRAPVCCPDWSPEAFSSSMYTGRVVFLRRSALLAAGGIQPGYDDPRYDMALRVSEGAAAIEHRPRMLYSERNGPAVSHEDDAKAVRAALVRRGEAGDLRHWRGDAYVVRHTLQRPGRVEIILPTRDLADDLGRCLASVFERTTYADFVVTIVDNGSVEPQTATLLREWARREPARFRSLRIDEPFNFSRLVNAGARATDGPYILLLNNDTEILTGDWLEAMLEQAQRAPVGAVGARLLYGDGTVQHAGVVIGLGALAGHVYRYADPREPGPGGALYSIRNYSAVTAACLMVRREVFEAVGGFDEAFAIEFNDVDFCLRLGEAGYRNVYLPHVELTHYESKSRGIADSPAKRRRRLVERTLFTDRWNSDEHRDPYYNVNLTVIDESGALAFS